MEKFGLLLTYTINESSPSVDLCRTNSSMLQVWDLTHLTVTVRVFLDENDSIQLLATPKIDAYHSQKIYMNNGMKTLLQIQKKANLFENWITPDDSQHLSQNINCLILQFRSKLFIKYQFG